MGTKEYIQKVFKAKQVFNVNVVFKKIISISYINSVDQVQWLIVVIKKNTKVQQLTKEVINFLNVIYTPA